MLHMLNRGDAILDQPKGNYAAVYRFGDTTVYIDDSLVVKTPEERERILEEIRLEGAQILREEAKRKSS